MELNDITTAITDNQDLAGQVLNHFKEKGFVIRTSEEDNTFKQNAASQGAETLFNQKIGDKTKEWYNQLDNDVLSVTGIQRNQDEKSYDYNKRAHQSNLEKIKQLELTNKELEAKLSSGDTDGVWKSKYENVESEYQKNLKAKEEELNKLRGMTETFAKSQEIGKIFDPIKSMFKKDLPGYFQTHQDHILNEVISKSKQKDGNWIMTKDGENELLDQNLAPIKVEDYLKQQFKDVFDEKRTQNGTGTGQDQNFETENGKVIVPADLDTRAKIQEYLATRGLVLGTKEYHEAYKTAVEQNKPKLI